VRRETTLPISFIRYPCRMYASLRGYISVWVGRNQNGQTDKRGQRKSIRRRRQTLIRKRSGSSIAVRWQWGKEKQGRRTRGLQEVAMSWRQANNSWRLDERGSRMTDHDKRCLT